MMKRRAARNGGLLQGGNLEATPQAVDLAGSDRCAALQNLQQAAEQRIGTRFQMRSGCSALAMIFLLPTSGVKRSSKWMASCCECGKP